MAKAEGYTEEMEQVLNLHYTPDINAMMSQVNPDNTLRYSQLFVDIGSKPSEKGLTAKKTKDILYIRVEPCFDFNKALDQGTRDISETGLSETALELMDMPKGVSITINSDLPPNNSGLGHRVGKFVARCIKDGNSVDYEGLNNQSRFSGEPDGFFEGFHSGFVTACNNHGISNPSISTSRDNNGHWHTKVLSSQTSV